MSMARRGPDESDILQISRLSGGDDEPDEDDGNFSLAEAMFKRTKSTPQKLDPRLRMQIQEKSPPTIVVSREEALKIEKVEAERLEKD